MKALTLITAVVCLSLASCGKNPDALPELSESRFVAVKSGSDSCVLDERTTLVWQVRMATTGLHAKKHTYSWFAPDNANGELDYRGVEDGGTCEGSSCDTWHYVQAVNEVGYCGHKDWRMPGKDELYSINDLTRTGTPPTIDPAFFPDAVAAEYWTGNDYSFQFDAAWAWNFALGHDRVDWKKEAKFVRLVRGNADKLTQVKE